MMAEKKKIAFGFVDVLIILAVVAVLVVFSFYATGKWEDNNGGTTQTMTYTVEVSNVDESVAQQFKVGDALRDSRKDTAIGTITKIDGVTPYETPSANEEDGTFVLGQKPGKYTVTFEVESGYQLANNSVTIGDVEIKVGTSLIVKGNGYAADALVLGVNR